MMRRKSSAGNNLIRVLFVTASTKGGGAERMLFNIIRSMDDNHEARLFITSDEPVPEIYAKDVTAINAGKRHAVSAFFRLLNEIRKYRPNNIFTTSSNIGYMLVLAKKILRARFRIYIRCAVPPCEIYQTDLKTRLLNGVIRLTYNSADMIIAQTKFMREDIIRSYKVNPTKVKTIRNIIDRDFVVSQAEKGKAIELCKSNYNIVAAGALYSVKGFDILIKAIAPLISDTNRHLYILGEERYEPGYRDELNDLIKRLGMENNIHLLGHRANPYPYFKAADLFVMSSRKEGYPNVVLEALSLSTPVVATDCVDWSGVITERVNGFIAKKNDIHSLREAIKKAMDNKFGKIEKISNYNYNELFL